MSPTVAECFEHARQCEWYAARTSDDGDRKFLLWRAQQWTKLAQEKAGQTLQATALVHEAYVRLVDVERVQHWNSRGHFFAAAAEAMRRILVDRARRKQAEKHGGRHRRVALEVVEVGIIPAADDLLDIDAALTRALCMLST